MGPAGVEPTTNQLCVPLRLSPPLSGLQSGLSLRPFRETERLPSSLYTFTSLTRNALGSGLPCCNRSVGFPEFDRLHLPTYADSGPTCVPHVQTMPPEFRKNPLEPGALPLSYGPPILALPTVYLCERGLSRIFADSVFGVSHLTTSPKLFYTKIASQLSSQ